MTGATMTARAATFRWCAIGYGLYGVLLHLAATPGQQAACLVAACVLAAGAWISHGHPVERFAAWIAFWMSFIALFFVLAGAGPQP